MRNYFDQYMSSAYSSILMFGNIKKSDCMKSTEDFINCNFNGKNCRNLSEICGKICNKEMDLNDIIMVNDNNGNIYAQNKKEFYIRHSER